MMSENQTYWRIHFIAFMNTHVYPAAPVDVAQITAFGDKRWQVVPVVEELKKKAKTEGLWNLFLPRDSLPEDSPYRCANLTNLEYAVCAEEMGKVEFSPEVFNCPAPDAGNMEVFARYASDATNIETSIKRDGDHYVINGRKWWSSGVMESAKQAGHRDGKGRPDWPQAFAIVTNSRVA